MFQNYLVAALRSLRKQRLFAAINILGLAVGLASCALIILFVQHEFSYDKDFANGDRLYRIEGQTNIPGQPSFANPNFFGPAYDLLPPDFEEIESVARLQQRGGTVVRETGGVKEAFQENFTYVDPEFAGMFDFPVIEGDLATTLASPSGIALTREMAIKHLGDGPWTGRTVIINSDYEREMQVQAVLEDLPGNTHFDLDFVLAIDPRVYNTTAGGATDLERWNGLPFRVYVLLREGRTVDNLVRDINNWVDRYFPSQIQQLVGIKGSELFTPRVVAVPDIHMESPAPFDMRPPGDMNVILAFSGVATLIMVIACINFTNLAAATSSLRAREVAVRKVMGASRAQLFVQFQTESLVSAVLALILALALLAGILPTFNDYTDRVLSLSALAVPTVLAAVIALTLVVGFIAGLHPALVMSGFRPARVLQSNQTTLAGGGRVRSILVLFQFAISAALIITTGLVDIQTDHARSRDLGYENSDKMMIRGLGGDDVNAERVRDEITRLPGVTTASLTSFVPGDGPNTGLSLQVPGFDERIIIFYRSVYPAFFEQFNVKPLAGRLLSDAYEGDRTVFISDPEDLTPQHLNVLINEHASRRMGFETPADAIGQVYYRGRENQIVNTIVGVLPNVHFGNPRFEVDAEIMMYIPDDANSLVVTFAPGTYEDAAKASEDVVRTLYPSIQVQVQPMIENITQLFEEETIQGTLLATFSILAILIACMGLFGLASFTVSQRTREIGIRKVMGASVGNIVVMLAGQFSRPVIIANVIAWPFCWYAVSRWMTAFNHQIDLAPWFAAVGLTAILVTVLLALLTVSGHALKVARSTPVTALRHQ